MEDAVLVGQERGDVVLFDEPHLDQVEAELAVVLFLRPELSVSWGCVIIPAFSSSLRA
jgi:hypothetical protein